MLTQERLKQVLHYNPTTGIFHRYSDMQPLSLRTNAAGYLRVTLEGKAYYQHSLAWLYVYGSLPKGVIDHINHDAADNRIINLREVTQSENMQNQIKAMEKKNSCGALGVCYRKDRKVFQANIKVADKNIFLGSFKTIEEASNSYLTAKRKFHTTCTI